MRASRDRVMAKTLSTGAVPQHLRPVTATVPPRRFEPKPVPPLSELNPEAIYWTKHAMNLLEPRGIGFYEVVAAVQMPDSTAPDSKDPAKEIKTRGDVRVVYIPSEWLVVDFYSRNSSRENQVPRTPLTPPPGGDKEMPTVREKLSDEQRAVLAPFTVQAPAAKTNGSAPEEVEAMMASRAASLYIQAVSNQPGFQFGRSDVFEAFEANLMEHYPSKESALSNLGQVLVTALNNGHLAKPKGKLKGYVIPAKAKTATAKKTIPAQASEPDQPAPATEEVTPVSTPPVEEVEEVQVTAPPSHDLVPLDKTPEPPLPEPWRRAPTTLGQIKHAFDHAIMPIVRASNLEYESSERRDYWEIKVFKADVRPEGD